MNRIRVLENDELKKWDSFVASHKLGTIYHTSLWKRLIENVYGHPALYIISEDEYGNMRAGLPLFLIESRLTGKRLSSVPCAQFCNPLVTDEKQLDSLISYVLNLKEKQNAQYWEIKTDREINIDNDMLGRPIDIYSTYMLDISEDLDAIKSSFHKSCIQRGIDKSSKSGLELVTGRSRDDVKLFYQLYCQMRRFYGLLPQPYSFFLNMWNILGESGFMSILNATYKGTIAASIIVLRYKDTAIFEYGASHDKMLSLRPNHFLLWEAVKRSKAQGCTTFDFGRTSDDNKGLAVFKSRWGTTRKQFRYYYIPAVKNYAKFRQKKSSQTLMKYIIKNLPPSIGQCLGALFYRHLV
jgi:hypothetical protein